MMDRKFKKYFVIALLFAIVAKWKRSCRYDPNTFPYSKLSEQQLLIENEENAYFHVIDKNFTIFKEPKMQEMIMTIAIKSAPGKLKYYSINCSNQFILLQVIFINVPSQEISYKITKMFSTSSL